MNTDSKRLTQEQLSEILDLHVKWIYGAPGGVRANLSGADLSGADLSGASLFRANLSGANLSGASLFGASLPEADLSGASLPEASLFGANLSGADLSGADLSGADLSGAYLLRADLTGASLPPPILDLSNYKVGYKKVWDKNYTKQVVIELRFPEGAKLVSTVIGRKCRASEAVVGRCVTPGHEAETLFWSMHGDAFVYRVGETAKPTEPFDDSVTIECTSGIHFFTTRGEAERYVG